MRFTCINETPEQRERRLQVQSEQQRQRRQHETPERRQHRLAQQKKRRQPSRRPSRKPSLSPQIKWALAPSFARFCKSRISSIVLSRVADYRGLKNSKILPVGVVHEEYQLQWNPFNPATRWAR